MDSRDGTVGLDHRRLQDEAVTWLVRRDGNEWSQETQTQFDDWLAQSTAHRVAFLRLEAGWEGARRLKALGAGHTCGTVPPSGAWDQSPFFESPREAVAPSSPKSSRRPRWLALVASLMIALGVTTYLRLSVPSDHYSTPVGGVASVPLRDGSEIMLNTHTQVRVDLTSKERHVDLDEGEAFFDVAKDPRRPIVVRAGGKRIVAVGTQFSVRRDNNDLRIVVTEGAVRLETDGVPLRVRLEPEQFDELDHWISKQGEPALSRPEAIRRLVGLGLKAKHK